MLGCFEVGRSFCVIAVVLLILHHHSSHVINFFFFLGGGSHWRLLIVVRGCFVVGIVDGASAASAASGAPRADVASMTRKAQGCPSFSCHLLKQKGSDCRSLYSKKDPDCRHPATSTSL